MPAFRRGQKPSKTKTMLVLPALWVPLCLTLALRHVVADATPRACVGGKYRPNRDIPFQEDLDGQTI
jgi:hypothetical protein